MVNMFLNQNKDMLSKSKKNNQAVLSDSSDNEEDQELINSKHDGISLSKSTDSNEEEDQSL